jgi:hypothetical protein
MKRFIALAALLAGGSLIAAPTAGATLVCPPGTTNPSYCTNVTPPSVATGGVTGLSLTSVSLAGSVNPNGAATTYSFQYGTTTAYGQTSAAGSLPASNVASTVQETIAGLQAGQTYHYRLVASNAGGTVAGADASFTLCPDGTTVSDLCSSTDDSGLHEDQPGDKSKTKNDKAVDDKMTCDSANPCDGTLYFVPSGHTSSAHRAQAGTPAETIYGKGSYAIGGGQTAVVVVKLTPAGTRSLEKTGKLTVSVIAVSGGIDSPVGSLTINGRKVKKPKKRPTKKAKHVTKAKEAPGFTG